jgi:hypothetical protein
MISWSSGERVPRIQVTTMLQSSPIDEWIGDIGEDVVVEGVATKHEKHEVVPPLVFGRRGF